MLMYLSIFGSISIFAIMEVMGLIKKTKTSKCIVYSYLVLFFLLTCIRWGGPGDWDNYYDFFLSLPGHSLAMPNNPHGFEIGYVYLNVFVRLFTDNYSVFLAVGGLILLIAQILMFRNLCYEKQDVFLKNDYQSLRLYPKEVSGFPVFSLLIVWTIHFSYLFFIRSHFAFAICAVGLVFVKKKKPFLFILTVLLAMLFHKSAIVFFVVYPIYHLSISKNWLILLTFIGSLLMLFLFEPAVRLFANFCGGALGARILSYLNRGPEAGYGSVYSFAVNLIKGVFNFVFLLILYFFTYESQKNNKWYLGLLNIYCFGCVLYAGTMLASQALSRAVGLFLDVQIFMTPYLIGVFRYRDNRFVASLVLIVYLLLRLIVGLGQLSNSYYPFPSVFG